MVLLPSTCGRVATRATPMHATSHVNAHQPGVIRRTVVWIRDNIVAKVIVGVLVAAGVVYLGINAPNIVPTSDVQVANVYNLPRDRGLQYLDDQGFTNLRVINVCSNSVAGGFIREVLLDDGSTVTDETVFVGPLGSKAVNIPLSTPLLVKVSTGEAC